MVEINSTLAIGPVLLEATGDAYTSGARINVIIWEGSTTSGDRVILRHRLDHKLLWQGRTDGTNTYLGANFGESGIPAPDGFYAAQLDSGILMVYLRED